MSNDRNGRLPTSIYVLAAVGGISACNLYYSQPLLPVVADSFGASSATIAYLPAVTQAGFACGIFAILPLADMVERRTLVATMIALVAVAVFGQGVAPTLPWLLTAGFAVGMTCIVPQLLTPYAALLSPPGQAGRAVGLVLSGILTGVLVSKIVAGIIGALLGWRWLYFGSSALMFLLALLILRILPPSRAAVSHGYRELIRSTLRLAWREPALRRHALYGALSFAVFMIFWSNYAIYLASAFGFKPDVAGLLGFAGIAGIVAATVAGHQIDRGHFNRVCVVSGLVMAASFLLMLIAGRHLWILIGGVVMLDAGMALCHSANQSSAFALVPEARGRINAIYMSGYFVGGAIGTMLGALALEKGGWAMLCVLGIALSVAIPLIQTIWPLRPTSVPRAAVAR